MSVAAVLIDVIPGVVLPSVVNEALLDGRRFPISWGRSLVDRHIPLDASWFGAFFRGYPSSSRGRALSLLGGCYVERRLYLVSNVLRLSI